MSDALEIQHQEANMRGRYFIALEDGSEAELTYARPIAKTVVADHTGVPPQHRNRGIAIQLVERLIADARSQGFSIVPQCSYVAAQFKRHPEWEELRA